MRSFLAAALTSFALAFAQPLPAQDSIPVQDTTSVQDTAAAQDTLTRAAAPDPTGEQLVDRVVAVVGDTILLMSDIQVQLQQMQANGRTLPDDPVQRAQLVDQLLRERVDQLVLLEAARDAGIVVEDAEVAEIVDQEIQTVQSRFDGSEAALRAELRTSGLTLEQYREILTQQFRDRLMVDRFLRQRTTELARPPVSEEEIEAAFAAQGATLGERPANVSFQQIIIDAEPSDSARAEARRTAEQVLQELIDGADFEVLARRYSDDPGTREQGGDLGWFRPGRMVPEFDRVVQAMRPGQTSNIVETDFGYHIIRLERARGPERQARHILIQPEITEPDRARARERADSVATAARAGANFEQLVERYMEPDEREPAQRIPLDRLPPAYADAFADAGTGDVVGPFQIEGADGSAEWVVAKITLRQEAGEYTLDDVREQLVARLQEQKMIDELVAELRNGMYVEVMM